MLKHFAISLGTVLIVAGAVQASEQPSKGGVKIGTLSCDVSSGWGLILGSSKKISCEYQTPAGLSEHYEGSITKIGADIGYTSSGRIIWSVIAPAAELAPGALAGNYGGVTASATVGVGLGANVLVGGSNKSIALQPVSVEGSTGFNVAAGIGGVNLKYDRG